MGARTESDATVLRRLRTAEADLAAALHDLARVSTAASRAAARVDRHRRTLARRADRRECPVCNRPPDAK